MVVDTRVLLQGLKDYRDSLEKHLAQLREEHDRLEQFWRGFNAVAEGDYADEFRGGWLRTKTRFEEYINRSHKITIFLNENITALEDANRNQGNIG